jgi:hypothetical protein
MELVTATSRARDICIFGAGNCSDVDLEQLARSFDQIHLVDLDGEALERARDELPALLSAKVVLHPDVDLSGLLDHLDEWGEAFPDVTQLGPIAVAAAHRIVRSLGQTFDVTLSTCVLSQLVIPFHRAWVMSASNWANLVGAIRAVHVATLAGATRTGGTSIVVFDVLSSKDHPGLRALEGRSDEELQSFVTKEGGTGTAQLHPDPRDLVIQLSSPGLAPLVMSPRLTTPWLWNLGDAIQLVYGLVFQRP